MAASGWRAMTDMILSRDEAVKLIAQRHFPKWTREHSESFVDDLIALGVFHPTPLSGDPVGQVGSSGK